MILGPHLIITLLVSFAWLIGMALGNITGLSLHVWAGVIVASSLALSLTELVKFPEPYNKKLAPVAPQKKATEEMELQLR
jgi:hypothetical protein